jgi:hypothetical protein
VSSESGGACSGSLLSVDGCYVYEASMIRAKEGGRQAFRARIKEA